MNLFKVMDDVGFNQVITCWHVQCLGIFFNINIDILLKHVVEVGNLNCEFHRAALKWTKS